MEERTKGKTTYHLPWRKEPRRGPISSVKDTVKETQSRRHSQGGTVKETQSMKHSQGDTVKETQSRRHSQGDTVKETPIICVGGKNQEIQEIKTEKFKEIKTELGLD